MTEIGLLDLDSPKVHSSHRRKQSVGSSWEDSNAPDKDDVPVHLFLSPTDSGSVKSSSSYSSRTKKRNERSTRETSFDSSKKTRTRKTKQEDIQTVLSSPSHSQCSYSSDSEDLFSTSSKTKKFQNFSAKIRPAIRANKIHDAGVEETLGTDFKFINRSKLLERKTNRNGRSPPADEYSVDMEIKKNLTESSYRDRIRDRFMNMKEKAVESLSRPQSRSLPRLKSSVLKQVGKKAEDLLKEEENEVSAAMKRHEKIKMRWREVAKSSLEKSQEDAKFFFSETEKESSETSPSAKKSSSSESPKENKEDNKVFATELLGIKEDLDLVEYVKAKLRDGKSAIIWEEKLFFPSTAPVPLENKLEPGLAPRFVEEEGIYVGAKIAIPKKVKNKMEQRILMTPESKKWFGKDGELISSTSPLKPKSKRPDFEEDINRIPFVYFKPAIAGDVNHQYMNENSNYVLDLDISYVEFSHHPLFSIEHVLAQRLKELYIKYKKRMEVDSLNSLTERLYALRKTRDNLKNLLNESGDNTNLKDKLRSYEEDIREVREMRYVEGKIDRQLSNRIIMTWKDLLKVRERQGYQNTSLKLDIKKKISENLKDDKTKWEQSIKQEVKEISEELKQKYNEELAVYQEKYEVWAQNNGKKVFSESLEKLIKIRKEDEDYIKRLSDTESVNESESKDNDEVWEPQPKPPNPVAAAEIKAKVVENFNSSFHQPGDPKIEFLLSKANNLDESTYNNKEELRRSAVKRTAIFIKIFYNGKEVCRSKPQPLNQNFNVTISQRFAIRILEWPESLMIEIHEEVGALNKNLLVPDIYLPFPDSLTTVPNSKPEKHQFSSKVSMTYHHTAVGAGCKLIPCPDGSEYNNQPVFLYTSGTLSCRIGWMSDKEKILAPPEKYWSVKTQWEEPLASLSDMLKSGRNFDTSKLKEWAQAWNLDPSDPRNSYFFYYLEKAGDSEKTKPSCFRLNTLLADFDFCKEKDIQNNVRLKLLRLRDLGEIEFRDMKMIPLNEKQIHNEIFKGYEKRLSVPYPLTDILSSDPLDGHRAWGRKYLDQVQQNLLKQYKMSKQNKLIQDIVTEESVPDIGTLGITFMKWLRPKRPLRPVRKERKKITPQNLSGQEINIIVNVVRAFEVPIRKDIDNASSGESIEGFSLVNVRPFVEISFRGATARTTAAEGANPTWNQDLQIPVTTKNENFPAGTLQSIKNSLYLHLFDEKIIDLIEDDSARETNIHQRLERHWLASMKIPFTTLYVNSRIEGTFKLYSPPVLLGYEREAHRRHFSGSTGQEPLLPQRDATYITLFVTVQPALNPPKPVTEKLESSEMPSLEKHLDGWLVEVTNMFPHRKIKTLVLDITGKSVCITRFIKPLPLPPIVDEESITPEMVARFVAMIPSVTENAGFPEYFDIWLTSDQILRLLCGDPEDHATLLCSYFLKLGLAAYVLLGSGIPQGFTAYVLVKEQVQKNAEYFLWDPTNGQKYSVKDSFCPLQKIYCLINDQNIWANIQTEEAPRRTKFDLTKRADWFPAFGKNILAPTGSIQPQSLQYKTPSRQAVDLLQDKIEKKLRDNLMKWRKKSRTQWNRYCAATLRRLLPKLEESTWNLDKDSSPDHVAELQHILASHKMWGFPINMPYSSVEAVVEAVKATGVHHNETEKVEFALAVYIHSYPNDVLSVWVYVASLVRRR